MPERGVREGRFLMGFFSAMLVLALTRAEIIDRFRAPPLTKVGGLVQAVGECPSDMREEFLAPVAEIAQKSGCTQSKVKTTLFRLRKKLRDRLQEEGLC